MPGHKPNGREHAALALAQGLSVLQAATAGNVDERTVYKWKLEKPFADRVKELRAGMIESGCGRLSAALGDAVAKLVELSTTGTKDDAVKLRACVAIIDSTLRVSDATEMRERLAALESQLAGMGVTR